MPGRVPAGRGSHRPLPDLVHAVTRTLPGVSRTQGAGSSGERQAQRWANPRVGSLPDTPTAHGWLNPSPARASNLSCRIRRRDRQRPHQRRPGTSESRGSGHDRVDVARPAPLDREYPGLPFHNGVDLRAVAESERILHLADLAVDRHGASQHRRHPDAAGHSTVDESTHRLPPGADHRDLVQHERHRGIDGATPLVVRRAGGDPGGAEGVDPGVDVALMLLFECQQQDVGLTGEVVRHLEFRSGQRSALDGGKAHIPSVRCRPPAHPGGRSLMSCRRTNSAAAPAARRSRNSARWSSPAIPLLARTGTMTRCAC